MSAGFGNFRIRNIQIEFGTNEVIVMRDGVIIERGETETLFNRPQEPYTKALMAAAFRMEANETDIYTT